MKKKTLTIAIALVLVVALAVGAIRSRFRISSTGVPACGLTCWWRC